MRMERVNGVMLCANTSLQFQLAKRNLSSRDIGDRLDISPPDSFAFTCLVFSQIVVTYRPRLSPSSLATILDYDTFSLENTLYVDMESEASGSESIESCIAKKLRKPTNFNLRR
jgi:hypothetical protein